MTYSPSAACCVLALLLPLGAGAASAQGSLRSGNAVFDRAVEIVLANFYRPSELDRFRDAVSLTVESFPELAKAEPALGRRRHRLRAPEPRDLAHRALSRRAASSITSCSTSSASPRATRSAASIRRKATSPMTASASPRRSIDGAIFVTDVYDGGPADKAGVLAGDEILWVDGKPFIGTEAFRGRTAASAILTAPPRTPAPTRSR